MPPLGMGRFQNEFCQPLAVVNAQLEADAAAHAVAGKTPRAPGHR